MDATALLRDLRTLPRGSAGLLAAVDRALDLLPDAAIDEALSVPRPWVDAKPLTRAEKRWQAAGVSLLSPATIAALATPREPVDSLGRVKRGPSPGTVGEYLPYLPRTADRHRRHDAETGKAEEVA